MGETAAATRKRPERGAAEAGGDRSGRPAAKLERSARSKDSEAIVGLIALNSHQQRQ